MSVEQLKTTVVSLTQDLERERAENERLRATPEMAGHTWCKLERALAAEAENERLRTRVETLRCTSMVAQVERERDAAETRLATAVGLLDRVTGCVSDKLLAEIDAFLASAQPAQPKDGES